MVRVDGVLPDVSGRDALEDGFRVRRIRDRLFRPPLEERLARVRARYRRVLTLPRLRAAASPRRGKGVRRSERGFMEALDGYEGPISDDALLRYDDAWETGAFSQFWVVRPARSGRDRGMRWMVGELRGGLDLYAIVAQWRTATGAGPSKEARPHRRPGVRTRAARSGAREPAPGAGRTGAGRQAGRLPGRPVSRTRRCGGTA